MCGIAGIVNYRSGGPVDSGVLAAMSARLLHRGPDDSGLVVNGNIGLAHQRLSIIDLDLGRQPMHGPDGAVIVFNGEIYNYLELRRQLESRYTFTTNSDTEVILAAYAVWGESCIQHFIGMFAFAIWSGGRLFMARDRFGIKPLYYAKTSEGLIFASEIKALLAHPALEARVNYENIAGYLEVGYTPGHDTLFGGIQKLPPAHTLTLNRDRIELRQYWTLNYTQDRIGLSSAIERFDSLFDDAIRLRLRSDVPVGVFLSGGIDSSAVVARLSESLQRNLNTFSVHYDMQGFDETRYARLVAQRFGTSHHEIAVTPQSFQDYLPQFVWHMDEPVTEAAAISLYYVSQLARNHAKVVLSGEGADEILAGYEFYGYMRWLDTMHRLPDSVLATFHRMARQTGWARAQKYLALARLPVSKRYKGVSMYAADTSQVQGISLFSPAITNAMEQHNPFRELIDGLYTKSEGLPLLNRLLHIDTQTWLPDDILLKADKMSMAASIELRVPFLDHRLAEFCASLPTRLKLRGLKGKYLLRRATDRHLPRTIINRKKMGFPTPLEFLFRGPMAGYARDVLLDKRTRERGLYNPAGVDKLLNEHMSGRDHHKRIWQLLVLELWHRVFIDGDLSP